MSTTRLCERWVTGRTSNAATSIKEGGGSGTALKPKTQSSHQDQRGRNKLLQTTNQKTPTPATRGDRRIHSRHTQLPSLQPPSLKTNPDNPLVFRWDRKAAKSLIESLSRENQASGSSSSSINISSNSMREETKEVIPFPLHSPQTNESEQGKTNQPYHGQRKTRNRATVGRIEKQTVKERGNSGRRGWRRPPLEEGKDKRQHKRH